MTLLAAVPVLIGISIAGAANLHALVKSTRTLHHRVVDTGGVGWWGLSVRWGVTTGLRVGVIMAVGLLLVTAGVLVGIQSSDSPVQTSEMTLIIVVFAAVPLAAAVFGWTLFALFWGARWASGTPYWGRTDSPQGSPPSLE